MKKFWSYLALFGFLAVSPCFAQTNFALLAKDGAWTWYNDPRALFHNGALYFGYVRNSDGKSALSALNLQTGARIELWSSVLAQKDDHNNPALVVKEDGKILAIHARHGTDQFFSARLSSSTNPVSPVDWSPEFFVTNSGAGVTYANPHQLSAESNRIYNFLRNQNFNPTVVTSTNGGQTWSPPQLFIRTGTGGIRPYVKYSSMGIDRIDCLYTDGHPRNLTNSLYHLFYRDGQFSKTDGAAVKNIAELPILHDSGERGSVIYQYSDLPSNDPNEHIQSGRAWCWETSYQTNGAPVALFTVQRDNVTGPSWTDDRIYYYYARWTGSNWQKRFIAHAGRPLYEAEDDYAGGICVDPENANVIYISSNAQNPFELGSTTNVPLRANSRYEIYRGTTTNGGLSFNWEAVTTNSTVDNLRPYMPRRHNGAPAVIWFRGIYTTFTSYQCEIVGLFTQKIPRAPEVSIINPGNRNLWMTNLSNQLELSAVVSDDDLPQAPTLLWTTVSGPTNVLFSDPTAPTTFARFPLPGPYTVRLTADDTLLSSFAETGVIAGNAGSDGPDPARVLRLRLDENSGTTAQDSSGNGNSGVITGAITWRPSDGMREGAIALDGATAQVVVADTASLDPTNAFTVAFWFKANAYPADSAGLVSKRNGVGDNNAYTTYLKASDQRIYVDIDGGNNRFSSSTSISTGQWYHAALTFDGSLPAAQRAKLWLDGRLDVTANETSGSIPNYSSSVRIGNTHAGATNWFNGLFDDVQFIRRALEGSEIQAMSVRHRAPSISAGVAPNVISEVSGTLTGSIQNGSSGAISNSWQRVSGPGRVSFVDAGSPTTSVKFSQAGAYTLRLRATDSLATVARDLPVLVGSNTNVFEDWAAHYFAGNNELRGETTDPDQDGVNNIFEFALGMNPNANDAVTFSETQPGLGQMVISSLDGTNFLSLKFKRPTGRIGLHYSAAVTGSLLHWLPALSHGLPSNNGDGTEIVTVRDFISMAEAPHRFLRLQVERQP